MKPTNLCIVTISPIDIGLTTIYKLEIDMLHVNHGIDKETKSYQKKARSNFTEIEIANIFSSLDGFFLNPSGQKDNFLYFANQVEYLEKNYMIVFCIDKNTTRTAGIITLYKIKK